jgi:RNase P subunit RPR2
MCGGGFSASRGGDEMAVTIEQIADAMYEVVKEYTGRKSYTARELSKEMKQKFGPEADRTACKDAIKVLLADGRCVYTYKGSSYVELAGRDQQ